MLGLRTFAALLIQFTILIFEGTRWATSILEIALVRFFHSSEVRTPLEDLLFLDGPSDGRRTRRPNTRSPACIPNAVPLN